MLLLPPKARASASFEDVPRRMAMRHEGGEERRNVSRSAVEGGEAARDKAPSAVAGGSLSPRWKCGRLHGRECSAEKQGQMNDL